MQTRIYWMDEAVSIKENKPNPDDYFLGYVIRAEGQLNKKQVKCIDELSGALSCVHGVNIPDLFEVLYFNEEDDCEQGNFHWLAECKDGRVVHIEAYCGAYTGWEICGTVRFFYYDSYEKAFSPIGIPELHVDGEELKKPMFEACYNQLFNEQVEKELQGEK